MKEDQFSLRDNKALIIKTLIIVGKLTKPRHFREQVLLLEVQNNLKRTTKEKQKSIPIKKKLIRINNKGTVISTVNMKSHIINTKVGRLILHSPMLSST